MPDSNLNSHMQAAHTAPTTAAPQVVVDALPDALAVLQWIARARSVSIVIGSDGKTWITDDSTNTLIARGALPFDAIINALASRQGTTTRSL